MHRSVAAALVIVMLAVLGCARAVDVGSADARTTYSVEVRNETNIAMIVRYNDGRADALLGSVAAGASERFIIASPATTSIGITGTAEAGDRRSGPHPVVLGAGTTVVRLR